MAERLCSVRALRFEAGGRRLLDDASFEVFAGDRVAVLGPNGAGKSLLLRLCHGLLAPGAGAIAWDSPAAERAQAMVFQRPVLLRRSVVDNVAYPLRVRGASRREARDRALEALASVGLAELAPRQARVLSGGEQQRVAMARAVVTSPRLLWLDEPTSNLDPAATRLIERDVAALSQAGCTIVMTTHDLGQARRVGTRVVFLHRGRVLEDCGAARFFERPASEPARRFVAGELLD